MVNPAQSQPQPITGAGTSCFYSPGHPRATPWGHLVPPQTCATTSQPLCAMTPLRLLLLVQVAFAGASWDLSSGATATASIPVPSLVVVASSSGARSSGGTEMSLVGTRGGRAQCQAGPCGKAARTPPNLLQVLGVPGEGWLRRAHARNPDPSTATASVASTPSATSTPSTTRTPSTTSTPASGELSTTQRYVLGSLAGLALALCPLLAVALLRCPLCRRAQRWLHPLLLGLAAGTLSGDALLHLLPQLLGSHSHGEVSPTTSEVSPSPSEVSEETQVLPWSLLGVLGGLYGAFLLEKLLRILLPHTQGPPPSAPAEGQQHRQGELEQQPAGSRIELVKAEEAETPSSRTALQNRGVPWTMTVGGAAHNLADGLALGAAFAQSWRSGGITGLALLCHGLPHAMGSVSVLSQSGLGSRRVLALVGCWTLPVLPGLYLGLALGTTGPARTWLGAIVTGLLLHLALADMVPAMVAAEEGAPWILLGLQSLGLLGGWGGMVGLAVAEDALPH